MSPAAPRATENAYITKCLCPHDFPRQAASLTGNSLLGAETPIRSVDKKKIGAKNRSPWLSRSRSETKAALSSRYSSSVDLFLTQFDNIIDFCHGHLHHINKHSFFYSLSIYVSFHYTRSYIM